MIIAKQGPESYSLLADVWERSVRATHDFLAEEDLLDIRSKIAEVYFPMVELYAAVDEQGNPLGFMGLAGERMEMLFVDPGHHRRGIGRKLLEAALDKQPGLRLDVNEQNPGALAFYKKCGFEVIGRSPVDGEGKPYPLLHLARR